MICITGFNAGVHETFQMLSISTVLAILAVYRSVFLIFVTDRHLLWQNRFILSRRLGSGEYYPLGAICYFTES